MTYHMTKNTMAPDLAIFYQTLLKVIDFIIQRTLN